MRRGRQGPSSLADERGCRRGSQYDSRSDPPVEAKRPETAKAYDNTMFQAIREFHRFAKIGTPTRDYLGLLRGSLSPGRTIGNWIGYTATIEFRIFCAGVADRGLAWLQRARGNLTVLMKGETCRKRVRKNCWLASPNWNGK